MSMSLKMQQYSEFSSEFSEFLSNIVLTKIITVGYFNIYNDMDRGSFSIAFIPLLDSIICSF